MVHPVLKNIKSLLYYMLTWILISGIHFFVILYFAEFEVYIALSDCLTYNLIFCFLGLGLWHAVRFSNIEENPFLFILLSHIIAGLLTVSVWLFAGKMILENLIYDNSLYHSFLLDSLPWRFISGILYYSVIILIYYLIVYFTNFREKMKKEAELQTLIKESELNMLKSQLNPHFLFNSLNSINSLTISKPREAREMIIKLSDFLRYALAHNEKEKTSLAKELENIILYLEIEKIRFEERLLFEQRISKDTLDKQLPNLILQPLFENAIKHGVYESTEQVKIEMEAVYLDNNLEISIKNNYDSKHLINKGEGIGLSNIRSRLILIYERSDLVSINRSEKSFEVKLIFPQDQSKS